MKLKFNMYKIHPTAKYNSVVNIIYAIVPGSHFDIVADTSIGNKYRNCIAFVTEASYKNIKNTKDIWQPYKIKKL